MGLQGLVGQQGQLRGGSSSRGSCSCSNSRLCRACTAAAAAAAAATLWGGGQRGGGGWHHAPQAQLVQGGGAPPPEHPGPGQQLCNGGGAGRGEGASCRPRDCHCHWVEVHAGLAVPHLDAVALEGGVGELSGVGAHVRIKLKHRHHLKVLAHDTPLQHSGGHAGGVLRKVRHALWSSSRLVGLVNLHSNHIVNCANHQLGATGRILVLIA